MPTRGGGMKGVNTMTKQYKVTLSFGSGKMGAADGSKTKAVGPDGLIRSINTNPLSNPFCMHNSQITTPWNVCGHCYSIKMCRQSRQNCVGAWERNSIALSMMALKPEDFQPPRPEEDVIRINSHGELINRQHLLNTYEFANAYPNVLVVLWTKRANLLLGTIQPPENYRIIYSNPSLDHVRHRPPIETGIINGIFNVVTNHNDPEINCIGKCRACMRCYQWDEMPGVIIEGMKKI